MKRWIISLLAACLLLPAHASHRDTLRERRRDHRVHLRYDGWERLRPTTVKYQFAGGMGVSSVGVGWDYGRGTGSGRQTCLWATCPGVMQSISA